MYDKTTAFQDQDQAAKQEAFEIALELAVDSTVEYLPTSEQLVGQFLPPTRICTHLLSPNPQTLFGFLATPGDVYCFECFDIMIPDISEQYSGICHSCRQPSPHLSKVIATALPLTLFGVYCPACRAPGNRLAA